MGNQGLGMIEIRLLYSFKCDHHCLPEGQVIGLPAALAERFVTLGLAEFSGYQKAIVEIPETRVKRKYETRQSKGEMK